MQILREVRQLAHSQKIPIVMLTARDGQLHIQRASHEGANDYITKPFEVNDLVGRVEALLQQ